MSVKCPLPVTRREPETPEPPVGLARWDKIALLAPNYHVGEMLIRENRDKPWIKVIWPGQVVAGFRFAIIFASSSTLNDILRGAPESYKRWWEECVKCRSDSTTVRSSYFLNLKLIQDGLYCQVHRFFSRLVWVTIRV
jgi:hypothetical protein